MNRARYAFAATAVGAATLVGALGVGGSALVAQDTKAPETKAPEFKSVLQGKKFTPPLRGAAEVDFLRSATQRQGNLLITKIQVKNMSTAPIPRLTIDEVWYDKNNEIIPGGKGVVPGLLQPGEIQTVEIKTPSNPAMARSMLQFSHANGTVPKPHAVTSFAEPKDSATKGASAKKGPAKKK
jgi:hypothetical protein